MMATTEPTMEPDSGVKQFLGDHPVISVGILTVIILVLLGIVLYVAVGV